MRSDHYALLLLAMVFSATALAHPMPNSVLLLDIKQDGVAAQLQWPLKELQLAFPNEQIDTNSNTLILRKGEWLDAYLQQHMLVSDSAGQPWAIRILGKEVVRAEQDATGPFQELHFHLLLKAPEGSSPRHFTMLYDAIMHQVVTHKMYIAIRQDWDGGLSGKDSSNAELGILMMNPRDNKVPPLIVNLDAGSRWKGFKSMVSLGIAHISEGTDHLLFLLVLLLPAPLLVSGRRWGRAGSARYGIIRLLKITTAFTIGHSLTLLLSAAGWIRLPSKPVEILIAVSILIGAAHALRPVFPRREAFVAAGFGLVHGLAFAATLANLHLDSRRMALSIFGFNIGIELMQLFVILITMPWLIILSNYSLYKWVRIGGGLCTATAAIAWIAERATQRPNIISKLLATFAAHGNYLALLLAITAFVSTLLLKKNKAAKPA